MPWITSRRAGEQPERREAERHDRAQLDRVAGALAHGEAPRRQRLRLHGRRALDAADELDRDPQRVLRRRLVQARAAHEARQHELRRLVQRAADERDERAHEPLGERDEERGARAHANIIPAGTAGARRLSLPSAAHADRQAGPAVSRICQAYPDRVEVRGRDLTGD